MSKQKLKKNLEKIAVKNLDDAVSKVKELSKEKERKFVESVDIVLNLGIDAKQSDQSVKGSVLLPHGSGKKVRVVVFTGNEELQKIAIDNGAMDAGLENLISKIENGFIDFDCCIATPDVMQKISKVARKLGPRGLMPSPKNNTVTTDIKKAVLDALKGKINFKNDKSGIVHCLVGKVNFQNDALVENIQNVIKSIKESRPEGAKGKFIKSFYINSTMGPSVQVSAESV